MTDILNPKIGSEILTKVGFLEPSTQIKVFEVILINIIILL